jgi:hypothetical protein
MSLEIFYNLKNRIIECFVEGKSTTAITEIIKQLAKLETALTNRPEHMTTQELDKLLSGFVRPEPQTIEGGPTVPMQEYSAKHTSQKSKRIDWVLAYGRLCIAREQLNELEINEQRLLNELDKN